LVEHEPERRLWAARLAAPVAFFAAATVLVILIESSLNSSSTTTVPGTSPTLTSPTTTPTTGPTTGKRKKRFYRVQRGDTLESIAAKFDTTVDDLVRLNPDVDPLALSPGQKIRVS
jgi:LysM repeat protein